MAKINELYLVCTKCRRIPDWTEVKIVIEANGDKVKTYKHDGVCPFCGNGEMEVVEVTDGRA